MESWLFLLGILAIAIVGKNKSLIIGVSAVMVLKLIPQTQNFLKLLQTQGINWGVTVISAAIMVPIATGEIGFKELLNVIKSPAGWRFSRCFVGKGCRSAGNEPGNDCGIGFWHNYWRRVLKGHCGWTGDRQWPHLCYLDRF